MGKQSLKKSFPLTHDSFPLTFFMLLNTGKPKKLFSQENFHQNKQTAKKISLIELTGTHSYNKSII